MIGVIMKSKFLVVAGLVLAGVVIVLLFMTVAGNDHSEHGKEKGYSSTDVEFAQGMIPHHEQAIEMAELVDSRSNNPKIKSLAADIIAAQDPEIKTLQSFLKSNNESSSDKHAMHGSDSMDADMGMATEKQMSDMESAQGNAFDEMFLEHMIRHHEGAVEMAQKELKDGENKSLRSLAKSIISAQEKEIRLMKDLQK